MAKKAAAISESFVDDVNLTEAENTELQNEGGEAPAADAAPAEGQIKPIADAQPENKADGEFVPRSRLNEVLARAKAAEEEVAKSQDIREKWARLEERQNLAREAQQRAQQAEEAAKLAAQRPDPDLDPTGARAWDAEQRAIRLEQQMATLTQQFNGQAQQSQQTAEQMQWNMQASSMIEQARRVDPQHDTKVDGLKTVLRGLWKSAGYDDNQVNQIVLATENALVDSAMRRGVSLNQMVTGIAGNVQGWAQALGPQGQNGNGNGGIRAISPEVVEPSANQKIDQIQRGQAMQGLGRVQSGNTTAQTPWEAMSIDEFKIFVANMPEDSYIDLTQGAKGKQFLAKLASVDNPE